MYKLLSITLLILLFISNSLSSWSGATTCTTNVVPIDVFVNEYGIHILGDDYYYLCDADGDTLESHYIDWTGRAASLAVDGNSIFILYNNYDNGNYELRLDRSYDCGDTWETTLVVDTLIDASFSHCMDMIVDGDSLYMFVSVEDNTHDYLNTLRFIRIEKTSTTTQPSYTIVEQDDDPYDDFWKLAAVKYDFSGSQYIDVVSIQRGWEDDLDVYHYNGSSWSTVTVAVVMVAFTEEATVQITEFNDTLHVSISNYFGAGWESKCYYKPVGSGSWSSTFSSEDKMSATMIAGSDGVLRLVYESTESSAMYEKTWSGGSWSSPSTLTPTGDNPIITDDGENLYIVYRSVLVKYIVDDFTPNDPTQFDVDYVGDNELDWSSIRGLDYDYTEIEGRFDYMGYRVFGDHLDITNSDEDYSDTNSRCDTYDDYDFEYRIRVKDDANNYSDWVTFKLNRAPFAPTLAEIDQYDTFPELSWTNGTNSTDVTSYTLQRSYAGGAYTTIYTGSNTSYIDTDIALPSPMCTVNYKVKAYDGSYYSDYSAVESCMGFYIGKENGIAIDNENAIPTEYFVGDAYPNPFNPSTKIGFGLPETSHISIEIYNALGQKAATLVNGNLNAGFHSVTFNASIYPSGTYFYRVIVRSNGEVKINRTGKLLLIK